jgi:hypothetical protein
MHASILFSIKKLLGIEESYTAFDMDILMHINSVFYQLKQMGVDFPYGIPSIPTDELTTTWDDIFDTSRVDIEGIKIYTYLKVRLLFDPPSSGSIIDAINKEITNLEWRINSSYDFGD